LKNLSIDIETFSSVNLAKSGVYRYAESPDFEILLFGYSVDGGPAQVVDFTQGEELPAEVLTALIDTAVKKWAFNCSFERTCIARYLRDRGMLGVGEFLSPTSWYCSMVWSAYMGLPLSLKGVGAVLGLEQQKMDEGKDLIRYFCCPCKPTQANGGRERNLPKDAPDKWDTFKRYNKRDVEVEMAIQQKLGKFPVPQQVWEEYRQDQEINDQGILVDRQLVQNAIAISKKCTEENLARAQAITGLENPNSPIQLKEWLTAQGVTVESLVKKEVQQMLDVTSGNVHELLVLRQQLSKSSVKKYTAMVNVAGSDDRARGLFQFYGANRSGRFAGRLVQLQNLARNSMPDLAQARQLVRQGNYAALGVLYDSVPDVLSQLIRTAFIPKPGRKFIVADFSAIECRVLAWLAGEQWVLDVFAAQGDIYCATAEKMFHVPVVKHGQNGELRQKGKQATLSCGYSGSVGALKAMGAIESGMKEDELQPLVDAWREANPNIVKFWWDVDHAAKAAVKGHTTTETHGLQFVCRSGMLFIELPSGRHLAYVLPRIGENRFGGESITYMGIGATKKWERIETFAGKLVENITQAVARDVLCYAMQTLRDTRIVMHVHDELIIEADERLTLQEVCEKMGQTPPWASGLLLRADGYECQYYQKD
jgi:DNA polymerase